MKTGTGYELFCEWCHDHNRNPPTREWWDWACKQQPPVSDAIKEQVRISTGIDDFDFQTERREG